ncbi:MAG: hypothetical protein FJY74_04685 [Candidatus Eisenbacteria bacterium]|nr:hypothetical protein [Candidatus Eisenbacteria bacterium]
MEAAHDRSRLCALVLALVVVAGLAGCAKKVAVSISSTVPAAQAEIKTSKDKNENSVVDLKVKYLAPPDRLTPPRSVYVVRVEAQDRVTVNVGRLKLSDKLEGGIRVTTPYKSFRIVVSAEDDALARSPGSHRVIETGQINIR